MIESIRSIGSGFLDLIFPQLCLVCGSIGEDWLCRSCMDKIESVPKPYCERCGHPLVRQKCGNCMDTRRGFTRARAAGEYSGVLREAIHRFKYNGHRILAAPLAGILWKYLQEECDFKWRSADLIIPVPMHSVRQRLRGYNQSELLAAELSRLISVPVEKCAITRIMRRMRQVELSREDRRLNVKGAFKVRDSSKFAGKTVLLIDDVATTCSTVNECALALRDAGAFRVYVLCLAFGS